MSEMFLRFEFAKVEGFAICDEKIVREFIVGLKREKAEEVKADVKVKGINAEEKPTTRIQRSVQRQGKIPLMFSPPFQIRERNGHFTAQGNRNFVCRPLGKLERLWILGGVAL